MRSIEDEHRRMLRARDAMDRDYALPLDVSRLADIALVSPAHFIRTFRGTFGETPHRYLQRRRIERAMYLLRTTDRSVTEVCMEVGFSSLGTFSRTFTSIVGVAPTAFREQRSAQPVTSFVPSCFVKAWTRPSSFGEAL
jgi:AraC-like DNA-binding protein